MRTIATLCLLLLALGFAAPPAIAASRLGASCDLVALGVHDTGAFLHFDNALREALVAGDAAAVARLVSYPLRLNFANGSHATVADAAAFESRAATLLPTMREAVTTQQPADLFCNAEGVSYGDGTVWTRPVQAGGGAMTFRVISLNMPVSASGRAGASAAHTASTATQPRLACSTEKFHIEVESMGNGAPQYRAWNLPHAPPDPPAMELPGTVASEGTGVCRHRVWRFRNGNTVYSVSEPGCTEGSEPAGSKALLTVSIGGQQRLVAWCK